MKTLRHGILGITLLAFGATAAMAENWSNWRGPSMNGSSPEKGLPEKFSKTDNVKWKTSLPGPSGATPVIWGDSVFLTSADPDKEELIAHCVDRKSGNIRWEKALAKGYRADNRSNYASPSPVTDGNVVVFFFGTGHLAALDFKGEILWKTNLQEKYGSFYFLWTFSTSPLLHDGKVIMQVLQRDTPVHKHQRGGDKQDSYLVSFDLKSGKELWKVRRPSKAKAEALEAFTTPIVHTNNGRTEILVIGGDCITGHDPKTGQEYWRWGTWNPTRIGHWRHVPSPVAGDGIALVCAPKKAPVYAIKLGGSGVLGDKGVAWVSEGKVSSDVSTPCYYEGLFYILNSDNKSISCVDPKSGKVHWDEELGTRVKLEASPTAADGKIYCIDFHGNTFVLKAGKSFKKLHETKMGEGKNQLNRSSIAVSQGNLFIRTEDTLFCIGK